MKDSLRIRSIRTLHGPSVFHDRPVIVMTLQLGALADVESSTVPDFVERLIALLPGLTEHGCSLGRPGGFVERLGRGTYLGHIVEHVALELAGLAGMDVTFGKTVYGGEPALYDVAVRFTSESAMRRLLGTAVELVQALLDGVPFDPGPAVEDARRLAAREALGPSTRSIIDAARRRDIPVRRIGSGSLAQLGYGANLRYVQAAMTNRSSAIGVDVACDKDLTKEFLRHALIPVPKGAVVSSIETARDAFVDLGRNVVVKPLDGNQGKGITLGVSTEDELARAFQLAREHSRDVIIEERFEGKDYRALVVNGKLVAASERVPAHVTGDGRSTIRALVARANEDPRRGDGHEKSLTKIPLDDESLADLARRGWSAEDVPPEGETVLIRQTANLSTGGTATDVTLSVHPAVRLMCERAALVVGLDVCGIDLILPDIATPPTRGGIIEVNAAPGLRMHLDPSEGTPRDVGEAIVSMLYPAGASARIPIVSITGTNGKTTTARLTAHLAASLGERVGLTTSTGVFVDGIEVARGDTTGPRSAEALLCDPTVELAVLETARGGIVRRGLGYDWSDVGVVTNVQADHLGQDGIETVEDLIRVKSVVAERVRAGGTLVANADCPNVVRMVESERVRRIERTLVWFSLDSASERVRAHVAAGGLAYVLSEGWLVARTSAGDRRLVRAEDVPLTFGGTAQYHIANALAAVAAARAVGVTEEQAAWALRTFDPSRHNSGRSNLYRVNGGLLLLDYGHNPEAIRAVGDMVERWPATARTCVLSAPGDRSDELIAESGRAAARFYERVIVKEDDDRRGREPGEVAAILERAVRETAPGCDCIVIADEREAARRALEGMRSGEVVVFHYDSLANVEEALARSKAKVTALPQSAPPSPARKVA